MFMFVSVVLHVFLASESGVYPRLVSCCSWDRGTYGEQHNAVDPVPGYWEEPFVMFFMFYNFIIYMNGNHV